MKCIKCNTEFETLYPDWRLCYNCLTLLPRPVSEQLYYQTKTGVNIPEHKLERSIEDPEEYEVGKRYGFPGRVVKTQTRKGYRGDWYIADVEDYMGEKNKADNN